MIKLPLKTDLWRSRWKPMLEAPWVEKRKTCPLFVPRHDVTEKGLKHDASMIFASNFIDQHFEFPSLRFGWRTNEREAPSGIAAMRRFVSMLKLLGVTPLEGINSPRFIDFTAWFDASSRRMPAYYHLGPVTGNMLLPSDQTYYALNASVYCVTLDSKALKNVRIIDQKLCFVAKMCGVQAVGKGGGRGCSDEILSKI